MDYLKPYLVSRARVKALQAMVKAGGTPRPAQLRRALEPVLGDLLPLPIVAADTPAARAEWLDRYVLWEGEAERRDSLGATAGDHEKNAAVDKRRRAGAREKGRGVEGAPW